MRPIRVMCVDDSEVLAESLGRRFRLEDDLEWVGWVNETSALRHSIGGRPPDVILLDVDMPGADPFQLILEIKSFAPDTRIAMLTGHVQREYFDRAVDSGADGYISKDDDPATIVGHIRRLAGGEFVVSDELGF
jgi:DNA-binding NarL/FixJ family response regulator